MLALAAVLCRLGIIGKATVTLASLALVASVFWSLGFELLRLQPWFGVASWRNILFAVDRGPIVAGLLTAFAISAAHRLADGVTILGPSPVRRSVSGVHGTADWLAMDKARALLGRGNIVLGEAYRVDRTKGGPSCFDPADKRT